MDEWGIGHLPQHALGPGNSVVLTCPQVSLDGWQAQPVALLGVEHAVGAQEGHPPGSLLLAFPSWNIELLPEHDLSGLLSPAHGAAKLQGLPEREPAVIAVGRGAQQDDVDATVGPSGEGVGGRARQGVPRPAPRRGPMLQCGEHAGGDGLVGVAHADPLHTAGLWVLIGMVKVHPSILPKGCQDV